MWHGRPACAKGVPISVDGALRAACQANAEGALSSPTGTTENSPAIHRWDHSTKAKLHWGGNVRWVGCFPPGGTCRPRVCDVSPLTSHVSRPLASHPRTVPPFRTDAHF